MNQDGRFSVFQKPRFEQKRWATEKRKFSSQQHKDFKGYKKSKCQPSEKLDKLHGELKEILGKAQDENGIISLMKYIQPSQQETHDILVKVTEDLRMVLSRCIPYFDIHPFGSAITGLLLRESDLDFFVRVPDNMLQNIELLLKMVEKNLWRSQAFTKIIKIPRARVPLIKFLHPNLNVWCDVNFTNPMGIYSSGFIQHLIQFDYRIYPLMMVIKFWATTHELSGTGKITNYCLVMMVIFFLQTLRVPLLPPVDVFQRHVPFVDVNGWNVAFDRNLRQQCQNMTCLQKLLRDFFDFISTYDYENMMMCPLFGKSYRKVEFASAVEPPAEFQVYRNYIRHHPEDTIHNLKPICVMDPFELRINIGGSCGEKHRRKFVTYATFAAKIFHEGELNGDNLSKILMRLFFENFLNVPMKKNPQKGVQNVPCTIPGIDNKNHLTVTLMPSKAELKQLRDLVQRNKIQSKETIKEINKYWVDMMGKFVGSIFREIYLIPLEADTLPGNSHNTTDYPKVFLASTEVNLWSCRKPTEADTANLIEQEIAESQRLHDALQPPEPLKFSLVLNTNNTYEYLQVSCIDRLMVRNNLKEFHQHFVNNVRTWLNGYLHSYRNQSKDAPSNSSAT
ncbi:poly(A) RNA polymerase, mitochondrial-like [Lutzomyia longipalpis]|uniref:poly(A) RNA polymerase, mitochondrial-like n=1 Tax=Lutzomyia longipalpis TaxID=7200 RepID=UPI002483F25A|nr:poly(A) RNA polymerase, mitochondrial-like [Lutzomyia longipalpis]